MKIQLHQILHSKALKLLAKLLVQLSVMLQTQWLAQVSAGFLEGIQSKFGKWSFSNRSV